MSKRLIFAFRQFLAILSAAIATALILGIVTNTVLNPIENGRTKKSQKDTSQEGEQI